MPARIAITGANGFIGGHLTRHFSERGFGVVALVHTMPAEERPGVEYRPYELSGTVSETELRGCDCLIHCAYAKLSDAAEGDEVNIEGTRSLYRAAQSAGVRKFIYLSSLSAHEEARSHYGMVKLKTEAMLDTKTDLILRPGLVIGHGGLFQAIAGYVRGSRFVPLVDGGRSQVQCIAADDLARCIEVAIGRDMVGEFALAAGDPISISELYGCISHKAHRKVVSVPVPFWLADAGLATLELLHIKTPVTRESLLGLKQNRVWDVEGVTATFGFELKACRQAIEQLD